MATAAPPFPTLFYTRGVETSEKGRLKIARRHRERCKRKRRRNRKGADTDSQGESVAGVRIIGKDVNILEILEKITSLSRIRRNPVVISVKREKWHQT